MIKAHSIIFLISFPNNGTIFTKDFKSYLAIPLPRFTSTLETTYFIALTFEHRAISFYTLLSYPNIEDANE